MANGFWLTGDWLYSGVGKQAQKTYQIWAPDPVPFYSSVMLGMVGMHGVEDQFAPAATCGVCGFRDKDGDHMFGARHTWQPVFGGKYLERVYIGLFAWNAQILQSTHVLYW